MLKKYTIPVLLFAFLIPSLPAFADRGERENRRDVRVEVRHEQRGREPRRGYTQHHSESRVIPLLARGLNLFFREGRFYRRTPVGYAMVMPPAGSILPAVPPGYTVVIINGIPYYFNGVAYYAPVPGGYMLASPPAMVAMPQSLPW
jgi:hypothetical protein